MRRVICLILALSLVLCGCQEPEFLAPGNFYYLRTDTEYHGSEGIIAAEQRELYNLAGNLGGLLELYFQGPALPNLESPFPPGLTVPDWTITGSTLTLSFDSGLAELEGVELTVAAACLARTFLPLSGMEELVITAGGELLNGETVIHMSLPDLGLRDDSIDQLHAEFTVYYASMDRRYLIGHETSVLVSSPEELVTSLLELLLTPPADSGLRSPLPAGTRFLSATTVDGLCTVDLSAEFENRRFYTISAQCISLLAIVNTLTGLDTIDRVEFTVEGNLLIRYGSLTLDAPLVRDERCIGPVRTGLGEHEALLYLAHGSESMLVPVPAKLRPSTSTTMPQLVMAQLLADPGTNDIRSFIPAGTALRDISVSNGTCYVDLSEAYLNDPEMLLHSGRVIAATLCELDGIQRVQILVNGQVPAGFDAGLFGPLVPEDDWFL